MSEDGAQMGACVILPKRDAAQNLILRLAGFGFGTASEIS
jgi:hypothetical protein